MALRKLLALLFFVGFVESYYLPGIAPTSYCTEDNAQGGCQVGRIKRCSFLSILFFRQFGPYWC